MMCFATSQYSATQGFAIAKEFVRGDALHPTNILFWDLLKINLPWMDTYDPTFPRVCKCDTRHNRIIPDFGTYCDETHATTSSVEIGS